MSDIKKTFIKWNKRIKYDKINAICKPCWELNYCPYGSLVEDFPIEDDEYSCLVFGHQCPVFSIAEPYTETKELREIERNIKKVTMLKVFRRDNQVCQICNKNIPIEDIHYDHIIPWSKGGRSDEKNIRLLCSECNLKRGNSYESDYLISRISYHDFKSLDIELFHLNDLLNLFYPCIIFWNKYGVTIELESFRLLFLVSEEDDFLYQIIKNIFTLLCSDFINVKKKMNILRYRWGLVDFKSHSINETCIKYKVNNSYYVECEQLLLERVAMSLKIENNEKYYELKVSEELQLATHEIFNNFD